MELACYLDGDNYVHLDPVDLLSEALLRWEEDRLGKYSQVASGVVKWF